MVPHYNSVLYSTCEPPNWSWVAHAHYLLLGNSKEVLDPLHEVHRALHVDSFDFSSLYTNIPHGLLVKCMA